MIWLIMKYYFSGSRLKISAVMWPYPAVAPPATSWQASVGPPFNLNPGDFFLPQALSENHINLLVNLSNSNKTPIYHKWEESYRGCQSVKSDYLYIYFSRPMSAASSSHTIVSDNARVGVEPIDYEEYVSNHSERRDDCNEVSFVIYRIVL